MAFRVPAGISWLLKGRGYLPYYGLPNILCEKFVVPEFIQDDATAANLAQATLNLYRDPVVRSRIEYRFAGLRESLGHGAAEQAARAVCGMLGKKPDLRR